MKKILSLLVLTTLLTVLPLAACGQSYPAPNGYDAVDGLEPTRTGLNDLRAIAGTGWGYALVAGDCVFTDEGYYTFSDILEYHLTRLGVRLGSADERALFFARGENAVYGLYRTAGEGAYGEYYAFSAAYDRSPLKAERLGLFPFGDAHVGGGGQEDRRLMLIGNTLIAYDFSAMESLAAIDLGGYSASFDFGGAYDFAFFQRGDYAVFFTEDRKTWVFRFDGEASGGRGEFEAVALDGDFSSAEYPAAIDGAYLFGAGAGESIGPGGGAARAETIEKYERYLADARDGTVRLGDLAAVTNGVSVRLTKENETVLEATVGDVTSSVDTVAAIVNARAEQAGDVKISGVKLTKTALYILLSKEPEIPFVGLRSVNDGIPQVVVAYAFQSGTYSFCGMIDFTWMNVYRIVRLDAAETA